MKIGIVGTGNVGGALAGNWASKGHDIVLGVRDVNSFKGRHLLERENITAVQMEKLADQVDTILIAAAPQFTASILDQLGDLSGKVVIDAMNSIRTRPEGYSNSFEAIKSLTSGVELVKCFNSTGFENMSNPMYDNVAIDMFMAGDSQKARETAKKLALAAGFAECYDFGGDDRVALLEQFAFSWINLAIMQGQGRGMAFKVIKR